MAKKKGSRVFHKELQKSRQTTQGVLNSEEIENLTKTFLSPKTVQLNDEESENNNRKYETHSDEITLREEILKLKRQVLILKTTNEQYLVKLRKYEDESKRKDKHLEQLMDPRKNSDITKVLSTKGAAILINLKDQNNALLQMNLNKDLHIRRLAAEIKMSKLYASTRKNESYRAEITRLRNLLIKSQETLKENVDVQQQTRSICADENSLLEFSSSSDQSSPRDLEELRFTILNLESHIKYSNELLNKKNLEISLLTGELNFLRKLVRYKTAKNKAFDFDFSNYKNYKHSTADLKSLPDRTFSTKLSSQDVTNHDSENLPHSAPAGLTKWLSHIHSTPKNSFQPQKLEQRLENEIELNPADQITKQENFKKFDQSISLFGKSGFHIIATDEIKKEKILSNINKTAHTKEKWKKALSKYKELKKLQTQTSGDCAKEEYINEETILKTDIEKKETGAQNFQTQEENQTKSEDCCKNGVSPKLHIEEKNESESRTSTSSSESDSQMCQNSEKNLFFSYNVLLQDEIKKDEKQHPPPESETKFSKTFEGNNSKSIISLREVYHQSLDSSFDSENSFSMKQEVERVKVEVQINSHNYSDQLDSSTSKNNSIFNYSTENNGYCESEQFNDDDDVIIRQK